MIGLKVGEEIDFIKIVNRDFLGNPVKATFTGRVVAIGESGVFVQEQHLGPLSWIEKADFVSTVPLVRSEKQS